MLRRLCCAGLFLAVAGCAAGTESQSIAPSSSMRSDRPQVFLVKATRKDGFGALANVMAANGWRVVVSNDYQLTFETDAKGAVGFMTEMMYGVGRQNPVYRLTANGIENSDGTMLTGAMALVGQPGSPRESNTPLRGKKWNASVMSYLEAARAEAARATAQR